MSTQSAGPDQVSEAWNALAGDRELLGDFILESQEHLGSIEIQLLTLEQAPSDSEAIHSIFRGFHTIKGLAGFLEIAPVQDVAHEIETVLDLARNGNLAITPLVIDRILEGKDYLGSWMSALDLMLATGTQPAIAPNAELIKAIRTLAAAPNDCPEPAVVNLAGLKELAEAVAEPEAKPETGKAGGSQETHRAEGKLIKVDTAKLDFLVDMIGEMVIAQSLVQHDPDLGAGSKPRLARNLSQLGRITDEIQKTAMSMRMVPVGQLFQKMSRLVRDLAKRAGKIVELETFGEDTELDRHIVEELADPLMHMVRNSIDHGIEKTDERTKTGKQQTAKITLRAGHQAGHILIQVSDDGRGLDAEKILAKAKKNGIVPDGAHLTEQEVFNLIFQPGFSTAEKVTDVSGRGVGMDVVRKQIQKLRGRIDIQSDKGRGTTFFLKVPLTLAIIDGLIVGVGEERYILPIYAVREMLRPSKDMISTVQGRSEMALVRGGLLPVMRLHRRFGVKPKSEDPCECLLIVAQSDDQKFSLLVDDLLGKQEVVIKSLGPTLQGIPGVAGGAILGDGKVGLILDIEGLYSKGHRE